MSTPGRPGTDHRELIRALGAVLLTPPPSNGPLYDALGLPRPDGADHTAAFVLLAPPYAAIHLGAEGKLGGEGRDRIAGFWRALGMPVPDEPDHLGVLMMSYAGLAESADRSAAARRAAAVLFQEHLWPFAPGYLTSVADLGIEAVTAWAQLTLTVLRTQHDAQSGSRPGSQPGTAEPRLPLALREAPEALSADASLDELLDAMVAPIRSGLILTQRDLAAGAADLHLGYRRGERRYALKAMLEQDKPATLAWLARTAADWCDRHHASDPDTATGRWWARRAGETSATLTAMAAQAG